MYRRIGLCTEQSSISTSGKFTPGPRREPPGPRVARKGPDHYPSWEVVARLATECGYSVCVWGRFGAFPPHGSPQQRLGARRSFTLEGEREREGCVHMTNACDHVRGHHYRRIGLCTEQSSISTSGKLTPGPRREPGTFRVARNGPDHYPIWEVVARLATECGYSVCVWGRFGAFPPHGSPQQQLGARRSFTLEGEREREGCVHMTNACDHVGVTTIKAAMC
jgi:hypothetical protein